MMILLRYHCATRASGLLYSFAGKSLDYTGPFPLSVGGCVFTALQISTQPWTLLLERMMINNVGSYTMRVFPLARKIDFLKLFYQCFYCFVWRSPLSPRRAQSKLPKVSYGGTVCSFFMSSMGLRASQTFTGTGHEFLDSAGNES